MKKLTYLILIGLASLVLACDEPDIADPNLDIDQPTPMGDNIFGCDNYEIMETERGFFSNTEPNLEVFHDFFVYEDLDGLVVKAGFNGPTTYTQEMRIEKMQIFNDQLIICAREGIFGWKATGGLHIISDEQCYDMTLDGQGRLLLQGKFGPGNLSSSYNIYEYKNNTIVHFANLPQSFDCNSVKITGGRDNELYAMSCHKEIAFYLNGSVQAVFDRGSAPFFFESEWDSPHEYHQDGLLMVGQEALDHYRIYKLINGEWLPLYDLAYDENIEDNTLRTELFLYMDSNILIYEDYLYGFYPGGSSNREYICRFDISGNVHRGLEDIELVKIPGLSAFDIIDIVIASDGNAYAVLLSRKIVKLTC